MKKLIKDYHEFLKERIRGDKAVFVIELLYVLFCLGSCVFFAVLGRWQNMCMALGFPLIVLCVCVIEWKCKVRCGAVFYVFFFLMASSNILGSGYGLYALWYPYFDKIMHVLSGIVCTCFGYTLMKKIIGGDGGAKFVYCLLFGFMFAMAVASLWEVYEYFVSEVLHNDMQTNYIVNTIDYENYIYQTYIYYTNGSVEVVDGYVDIGLFDTLQDITVCLCGSVVTIAILILDNSFFKRTINRLIVPKIIDTDSDKKLTESENKLVTDQKTA